MNFYKQDLSQSTAFTPLDKIKENKLPECKSAQEFFAVKDKRKKFTLHFNRDVKINQSFFQSTNLKAYEDPESDELKFPKLDQLTANTDHTIDDSKIQFRRKKTKVKINKIQNAQNKKAKVESSSSTVYTGQIRHPHQNRHCQVKKQKTLADFHILKKIGEGTFSEVFLAIEKNIGFICCLKKMKKKQIVQNNMLHVLARQIKNHFFLKHQNIIDLYGMFEDGDCVYLILEYCTNGDLFHYLKKVRRSGDQLPQEEIISLIKQISMGIHGMHNEYVMHRDLKPQNIFLTLGNVVKIGDLGCSVCYSDSQLRNTQCGTPLYLAPELIGKGQYSESVDIWAIGVLAYELLSGYSPFTINSARDLTKVVNQQIDFEYIDEDIARDFVQKLLQKNVEKRYEIEDVLDHEFLNNEESEDNLGNI